MKRLYRFCFKGKISATYPKHIISQGSREIMGSKSTNDINDFQDEERGGTMENKSMSNVDDFQDEKTKGIISSRASFPANVIVNHNFSKELESWSPNCCEAYVVSGNNYAVVTNRTQHWQGLEQDITGKVSPGSIYKVSASVGISGPFQSSAEVQATLKLEYGGSKTDYLFIERTSVSKDRWTKFEGSFSLKTSPDRVVFYLEGPPPGVDLLIESVVISSSSIIGNNSDSSEKSVADGDENIILNPRFEDGLNNWSGRGCRIVLHDSMADGKIKPLSGKFFAAATGRKQSWNGIQQEITGRVQRKLAYEVIAVVRIFGNNVTSADVRATLWVQAPDLREQYISIANLQATEKDWVQLRGKFLLNSSPLKVVIYLEGPPQGVDILLNSLVVKHAAKIPPSPPPVIKNPEFGVNIIVNSSLTNGTDGWFPLGNCILSVGTGSPVILPPMVRDSLGPHQPLSGLHILVTNRTQTWMGPSQMITDKLRLFVTYQVSAWVRIGYRASGPQNVNIALSVDGQWVNGGQIEINDDKWHEIGGSFRIEKQPAKVMVYVQGPNPGIDVMISGLMIFAVDRQARFKYLMNQTDVIRKRDVILKFNGCPLLGTFLKVKQTKNSFPFGSCVNRTNIDNEDFNDFFIKNFNWAVFGNELKWYWTEPQKGNFNYKDADELLSFCDSNNIPARGHCIFWEVESSVQSWVRALNRKDLAIEVQNRLNGLLTRYKGKFKHYDVNNEMLHGSFFQDRLGKDIRANMFRTAKQLDPSATLFVNDYHVEDGADSKSSLEKYIDLVLDLQGRGAPVGGVGVQGHIDCPVGPIVCSALDKLGILGLPIWFTELDVSSVNEFVRADDLEVMLREAFAHPAVGGVMLWGFWELFMSRENSHLVNAEGDINEAGRRYVSLKEEWLTHAHGHVGEHGRFEFRGFHGTYEVEIISLKQKVTKKFVVDKGESPLVVSIDL